MGWGESWWGGVGHARVGWVEWVMQGWNRVGWFMQGWGGVGHEINFWYLIQQIKIRVSNLTESYWNCRVLNQNIKILKILNYWYYRMDFMNHPLHHFLWMTPTQEIITQRVLKIHEWIWGMCMSGGKFLKEWQVTDKITESIFMQFIFNILQMTQTQKIITHGVSKNYVWIQGYMYGWGKVS